MNITNAFPSNYLKAADFEDGEQTLTISKVEIETLGQGKDAEDKPVLYFEGQDKGMVLNKTNANTITGMYGSETDDWTGKRVTLYATEVQFGSEMTMSIRVRAKRPAEAPKPAADKLESVGKAQAWNAYKIQTPNLSSADRAVKFKTFVSECWPNKDVTKLTEEEWAHVKNQVEFVDEAGEVMPI